MTKKLHDKHYDSSKKLHTEIKHLLFHNTLKTSVGKASALSSSYVYLDLFAGDGTFKDGSFGSPIIALKEFSSYLSGDNKRNKRPPKLKTVECGLCEKHGKENLIKNLSTLSLNPAVSYSVFGDWEEAEGNLRSIKRKSSYGFIFADQFATELNLRKFIDFVGKDKHDFLIFYNPQALLRLKGRGIYKHISTVTGVSPEAVMRADKENFKSFILNSLRKNLRELRNFVVFAAIPNTRGNKLIWSDYFYLALGTNDPHVADAFVQAYEKAVEKYRIFYRIPGNLFFEDKKREFKEFIFLVVRGFFQRYKRPIDLRLLYLVVTFDLLSWKDAVGYDTVIPTMRNVREALNRLRKEGKIKISGPKGTLKKDGDLKSVILSLASFKQIYIFPT